MEIKFTIPGSPKGKARPRFDPRSKRTYTPEQTVSYENFAKLCYINECRRIKLHGAIFAEIKVFMGIPNSTSKKQRDSMLAGRERPTKKPDCDNIAKIILDALNGIAYDDDRQIVEVYVSKRYSDEPRVEVTMGEF